MLILIFQEICTDKLKRGAKDQAKRLFLATALAPIAPKKIVEIILSLGVENVALRSRMFHLSSITNIINMRNKFYDGSYRSDGFSNDHRYFLWFGKLLFCLGDL